MNDQKFALLIEYLARISNRLHIIASLYALSLSNQLADDNNAITLINSLAKNLREKEGI